MTIETTLDGLLNRRVTLEQPQMGYRIAVDTILLAAASPAQAGDKVLDLGCGVGGAILCLACRVSSLKGVGIDIQPALVDIFRRNIARNSFASGLTAQVGDVGRLPSGLIGAFDHVIANPPYHEESTHDVSANKIKQIANTEKEGDLALWVTAAAQALKPSGTLTLIHRADRQEEILHHLAYALGDIHVIPVQPKKGAESKRIIIRASKSELFVERTYAPLVLHTPEGAYTPEVEGILRNVLPINR